MRVALNYQPGGENEQAGGSAQQGNQASTNDIQISPPKTERAEGPFEHSGETSGWTEEEKAEKEEQEQNNN